MASRWSKMRMVAPEMTAMIATEGEGWSAYTMYAPEQVGSVRHECWAWLTYSYPLMLPSLFGSSNKSLHVYVSKTSDTANLKNTLIL